MNDSSTDRREIEKAFVWLNKYWNRPVEPLYYAPVSLEEALSLFESYPGEAKIMAGGIDVVGLMKNKVLAPGVLVNIKSIRGMNSIEERQDRMELGALLTIHDMEQSHLIRTKVPLLYEAARSVGSPHIRRMGTLGGNLCQDVRCWYYRRSPLTGVSYNCRRKEEGQGCFAVGGQNENHSIFGEGACLAVCPSDMATALSSLDAEICTVSPRGGRAISVSQFFTSLGHVLEPDEMITGIRFPALTPGARQRYLKFRTRKAIDFATVSVSSVLALTSGKVRRARIVLGGVSSGPWRATKAEEALTGNALTERVVEKAAEACVSDAMPLSKNGFKVPLVRTLVKRSLLDSV